MAVWVLRVGYVGLAVAIAGIIVMSLGSTPWVLFAGVIIWLASTAVTLGGFCWSGRSFPSHDLGSGRCGSCSSTTRSTLRRRPSGPDGSTDPGDGLPRPTLCGQPGRGPTAGSSAIINRGYAAREEYARKASRDLLRTWEGGLECRPKAGVASNAWGLDQRPSEQKGKEVSAGGLDDGSRCRVRIRRVALNNLSTHGNDEGGTVARNQQPRALEVAVERAVIGSPNTEPFQSGRQCRSHEQFAPIIQSKVEIGAMDLDLSESQERQT
jgi:hypothetical protein